jgi:hypothetical protein
LRPNTASSSAAFSELSPCDFTKVGLPVRKSSDGATCWGAIDLRAHHPLMHNQFIPTHYCAP